MGLLEDMYKAVILEHAQRPRNRGALPDATVTLGVNNPSCGDEVELRLRVVAGVVEGVAFEGAGCAISQASASLMTQAIKGRSVAECLALTQAFQRMLRGEPPEAGLGDLAALQGVSKLHARVKCASLAWQALERALSGAAA